ncbi:MAG TPA: polysaccharide deacetylase family protein [Candidatus Limnocylindrales bacterium]|nr:polysaccharide deacetylase family protein [Candidatus Limnocylindrales bacterium]
MAGVLVPRCVDPPTGLTAARLVFHGDRKSKVIALTFDDGYDADTTQAILKILVKAKVNATFFPIGRAIEREPDTWKAIVAAGFPIGNHTQHHATLKGRCYDAQLRELTLQEATVQRILGIEPMPMMRPPGGAKDRLTRLATTGAGETAVVMWDVDTKDWSGVSRRTITARALAGTNGSIVLMHTFVENTAAALPRIIAGYRARGYRFVTVGQLLGIPGPVPFS